MPPVGIAYVCDLLDEWPQLARQSAHHTRLTRNLEDNLADPSIPRFQCSRDITGRGAAMIATEAAGNSGHRSAAAGIRWRFSSAKRRLIRSPVAAKRCWAATALASILARCCPAASRFHRSCFTFCFAIVNSRTTYLSINRIGQNAGEEEWR